MKKAMVYVLALTLAFSALLAGCGEIRGTDGKTTMPTSTPQQTGFPETMMPNAEDGVVNDRDGIITDGDNGTVNRDEQIHTGENQMRTGTGAGTGGTGNGYTAPGSGLIGKR